MRRFPLILLQHEGIGTVKMRSNKPRGDAARFLATPTTEDTSVMSLIQTATAAVLSPVRNGHQSTSARDTATESNADEEDEDEDEEDLLADDGLSSSSEDEYRNAIGEEEHGSPPEQSSTEDAIELLFDRATGLPPPPRHAGETGPSSLDSTPKTAGLLTPKPPVSVPSRQNSAPGFFDGPARRLSESSSISTPGTPGQMTPGGTRHRRPIFKRNKSNAPSTRRSTKDFNFDASQARDVLGIVMVEIKGAADLPKIKNCTCVVRMAFD